MLKIYKASTVKIDTDNKVSIKIMSTVPLSEADDDFSDSQEQDQGQQETVPVIEPEKIAEDIISKARAEAEKIKKNASREAKEIVEKALKDAEKSIEELREQSCDEGYQKGYGVGTAEADKIRAEAQGVYDQAVKYRDETISSIEPDMLDLIVSILDKLLSNASDINKGVILSLIRQGVTGATLAGNVTIHVSRQDYDTVVSNRDAILSFGDFTNATIEIVQDTSLHAADCIIETAFGNIECSLDRQYAALKESLYYILDNR